MEREEGNEGVAGGNQPETIDSTGKENIKKQQDSLNGRETRNAR